ncbi:MAG TPA: sulfotransferase [Solirubrobacteraceae bacterium]|nr:sulfotransferase [Solirubrobacteraceae bacterium]
MSAAGEPVPPEPTAMRDTPGRTGAVFIMGSGHSGSTILGVALGNCRGVFFAGELDRYLSRSGTPVLGGLERTRFWAAVRAALPDAQQLYGSAAHRLLERSSAVLRVGSLRRRRALRAPYRSLAARLFEAIAVTGGAEYVVDTSHFPLRARELQHVGELELCLVFLVRDPQAVVASIGRLESRRGRARRLLMDLRTNADLWLTYAISLAAFSAQPPERRVFVRYEDFLERPEAVLRTILDRAGSTVEIPDLEHLRTGPAFHANRLISSEEVALGRGGKGHPPRHSTLTSLLQWPWSRVFARLEREAGPPR